MGLTELPSELFRMKNLMFLNLSCNMLCSLPSEIAHLTMLESLYVRSPKRFDRDLTIAVFAGQQQPTHVSSDRALSADQSQWALCATIEAERSLSDPRRAFRSAAISSRRSPQKSASCDSSTSSRYEIRIDWIVI
jgi:hypothetical protein